MNGNIDRERFNPSNAYCIGGHGSEHSDIRSRHFYVPPNCIIIVKVYSGATSREYPESDGRFIQLGSEILKNPLQHIDKLIEQFGSIRIYKPGDECPNFEYTMLSCFNREYCTPFSGLIDLDRLIKQTRNRSDNKRRLPLKEGMNRKEIVEYFSNLFHYSIFPRYHQSKKWINEILDDMEEKRMELNCNYINYMLDMKCKITQSDLCRKETGVFYNFACRYIPGVTHRISSPNNISWIHPNISSILSPNAYITATRKRIHISENKAAANARAKRIENNVAQYRSSYNKMPTFKTVNYNMENTIKNRLNESLHRKKMIHNVYMTRKNNKKLDKDFKELDRLYNELSTYKQQFNEAPFLPFTKYFVKPHELSTNKKEYQYMSVLQNDIIKLKGSIEKKLGENPQRNRESNLRRLKKYKIFNELILSPNIFNESKEEVD